MGKHSVITDYSRIVDDEFDNFADSVYKALNPNPNFTWAATVMPQFQTNITTYRTKLQAAKNGTSVDIAAKNAAKAVVATNLRDIATDVNKQANGDLVKLLSSGLTLAKERSKKGILPEPTNLKVVTGTNSGDLLCTVDTNDDATMYNFYTAPMPAPADINAWRLTTSTTRKKNISGFTPGTQYAIKCAYQGTDPTLVYSKTVTIYAQ